MPARTNRTMGAVWSATLNPANHNTGENILSWGLKPPADFIGINGLGAGASIVNSGPSGDTRYFSFTGSPVTGWIFKTYWPFVVSVGAGMYSNDSVQVYYQYNEVTYPPGPPPSMAGPSLPTGAIVVSTLQVPVTITVTGIFSKAWREDNHPETRQLMDPTDMAARETWWADENTAVTVEAIVGGETLTATAALSWTNEEIEIGQNFNFSASMILNRAPVAGIDYAEVTDISCSGSVGGGGSLNLYNPGLGIAPDTVYMPNWKPELPASGNALRVHGDAGQICMQRVGTTEPAYNTYTAYTSLPYLLTFVPDTGKFQMATLGGESYVIEFQGAPIEWVGTTAVLKKWTETLIWDEWGWTWMTQQEKQRYSTYQSGHALIVYQTDEWREEENEDVGQRFDENGDPEIVPMSQNDQQCVLWMHSREKTQLTGSPWWASFNPIVVSHDTSINVNDPAGVSSRPSLWTGTGGASVDPLDNDTWTIAASSSAPKIERTLATRYWLRMARLADHANDPAEEHNPDWPLMLYPNLAISTTLDDPDWWTSIPGEDEWHWEFAYLQVGIIAPKSGQVTLQVNYSTVEVSDPCYTCFEHRFGAEGEWEYTRTQRIARYTFDVVAGSNTILIDLACADNNVTPVADAWLMHIDKLTFELPASGAMAEAWSLEALNLTLDPGEGTRPEPSTHDQLLRYWRQWNWIGEDWVGYDGIIDGIPALQVAPLHGYGNIRHSRGIMTIQKRQHCPDTVDQSTRLDVIHGMSRLADVISWCRGWSVTWSNPVEASHNVDADDEVVSGGAYAFDLRHTEVDPHTCAFAVGTYYPLAGIRQEIFHTSIPQGKITGLVKTLDGTARERNSTGGVKIYDASSGLTLIAEVGTDAHGRFMSPALHELSTYKVNSITGLGVTNRELTWRLVTLPKQMPGRDLVSMYREPIGGVQAFAYADASGNIMFNRIVSGINTPGTPVQVAGNTIDWSGIDCETDGSTIYVTARDFDTGELYLFTSQDYGDTWTDQGIIG